MKFVDHKTEYMGLCPSDQEKMLRHIEICGRVAYKSEGKINEDSHIRFFNMIGKAGHTSVFSHSNLVLEYTFDTPENTNNYMLRFVLSMMYRLSYFRIIRSESKSKIIAGSTLRTWLDYLSGEGGKTIIGKDTLNYLKSAYPIIYDMVGKYESHFDKFTQITVQDDKEPYSNIVHIRTVPENEQMGYSGWDIPMLTFKFTTDRGISHELVRHVTLYPTQLSTRYVNYNNKEMEFVCMETPDEYLRIKFNAICNNSEVVYKEMIEGGMKPQFARNILPNSLMTEVIMTGRLSAWDHFITVRNSAAAHPSIRGLAKVVEEFVNDALDSPDILYSKTGV